MTVVQLSGVHGTQIGQLVCVCIVTTMYVCARLVCAWHVHTHEGRRESGGGGRKEEGGGLGWVGE